MTPTSAPFTFTDDLAAQLAAAVRQVPGVHHLDGGRFGETSTYTPTSIITGVSYDADQHRVQVGIAVQWPHNLVKVAAAVRKTVARSTPTPVDVYINDLVAPAAPPHI